MRVRSIIGLMTVLGRFRISAITDQDLFGSMGSTETDLKDTCKEALGIDLAQRCTAQVRMDLSPPAMDTGR